VNQAAGTVKSPAKNGQKKKIGFLQENEDLIWKISIFRFSGQTRVVF